VAWTAAVVRVVVVAVAAAARRHAPDMQVLVGVRLSAGRAASSLQCRRRPRPRPRPRAVGSAAYSVMHGSIASSRRANASDDRRKV
jgi:hypothetical protein